MKSNLHLLALGPGGRPGARSHASFLTWLLILPWIASAPAQNVFRLSPKVDVEAEPQLAPLVEPMPSLSTNWYLGSSQGAGLDVGALAEVSPQAQPPSSSPAPDATSRPEVKLDAGPQSIWEHGVGEGFQSTTASFGSSAGVLGGMAIFGGKRHHDLALVSLNYGHMLSRTLGEGHWYRGNPEFRLELFTGAQFHPETQWLVGLTPHLRYNFATGTRWVPFFDIGAGVTATGIGAPDLSGTFEFNLQGGFGIQWFIKDNLALSAEARYVHWSCAGITQPNDGLNGIEGLLGLTYFF